MEGRAVVDDASLILTHSRGTMLVAGVTVDWRKDTFAHVK